MVRGKESLESLVPGSKVVVTELLPCNRVISSDSWVSDEWARKLKPLAEALIATKVQVWLCESLAFDYTYLLDVKIWNDVPRLQSLFGPDYNFLESELATWDVLLRCAADLGLEPPREVYIGQYYEELIPFLLEDIESKGGELAYQIRDYDEWWQESDGVERPLAVVSKG